MLTKYEPLTTETAIQLVVRLGLLENQPSLTCEEIGDGNLNLVFRVFDSKSGHSIIVKQALPYAKVVGENWPLTLKRATIESQALRQFYDLIPSYVPKIYYSDETLAVTIMEDLSELDVVRKGLIEGKQYPNLSKHIGEFLGTILFLTSDFALKPEEKKCLAAKYLNPELCKITEDLVFTDPFFDHETNDFPLELTDAVKAIWQDEHLLVEVAKLKKAFITEQEALLHGDLHTGSIFANEECTKVIDPEFAFFGPIGFDIGQFFANILLNYVSKSNQKRDELLEHLIMTWNTFKDTYSSLWESENVEPFANVNGVLTYVLDKAFHDTIGFCGCEMIRRTIGLAHVADLDSIKPFSLQIEKKKEALQLGAFLIKQRKTIQTIEQFVELVEATIHVKETTV